MVAVATLGGSITSFEAMLETKPGTTEHVTWIIAPGDLVLMRAPSTHPLPVGEKDCRPLHRVTPPPHDFRAVAVIRHMV